MKFIKTLLLGLVVIAAVMVFQSSARASSINFGIGCPAGQNIKTVTFGTAQVATCDGGGSAQADPNADDAHTVSVSCANGGVTETESGGNANNIIFKCNDGSSPSISVGTASNAFGGDCNNGGVSVGVKTPSSANGCVGGGGVNPIYAYVRGLIIFVSGLFGILVVLMIIVSGIQYITSTGNPQAVANAKKRLGNAVLGIILFSLMVAILNYLIPGGLIP